MWWRIGFFRIDYYPKELPTVKKYIRAFFYNL